MKRTGFGEDMDRMEALYLKGMRRGTSTGWASLDGLYTVAPSAATVVTGIPNHGKSAWLDSLLVNLLTRPCEGRPWRFLVCSPEQEPLEMHKVEILERVTGRRFRDGRGYRMTWMEVATNSKDLDERFEFALFEANDRFSNLMDTARAFARECDNGGRQPGIVFDPWNRLEHRRLAGQTETDYISEALSDVVSMTRATRAHMWIVAHPHMLAKERQSGKRPIPTPYDISGSANWFNKPDACICVWRDTGVDQDSSAALQTQIHVQKMRWRHLGRIGVAELRFDLVTGRYHDNDARENYLAARDGE